MSELPTINNRPIKSETIVCPSCERLLPRSAMQCLKCAYVIQEQSIHETYKKNKEADFKKDYLEPSIKKSPWWVLSFVLNSFFVFLMSLIILGSSEKQKERSIIKAELPAPTPEEFEPEKKIEIEKRKKEIPETNPEITEKSEVVPLTNVEVSDHFEADTDSESEEMLEADPDSQLLSDKSVAIR